MLPLHLAEQHRLIFSPADGTTNEPFTSLVEFNALLPHQLRCMSIAFHLILAA